MKLLGAGLAAALLGPAARGEQPPWPDKPSRTCFFQTLSSADSEFCRGDLEIIYPELGDVGCMYIPRCHQYRRRISREWGSPRVRYPQAEKWQKNSGFEYENLCTGNTPRFTLPVPKVSAAALMLLGEGDVNVFV
ncbi:PREDICTED: phosphatidylethanolamine-binding protein 4, partial [Phaethon lepturus]|uniref:phosphatidylethanolamine-binding protein 4 n=1 Tax=Phaethon lepturus TaxID=97097 RepID=UPI000530AD5D